MMKKRSASKNNILNESSSSEYENKARQNDYSMHSDRQEMISNQNYFNMPSKRTQYGNIPEGPIRPTESIMHESENEDPNHTLMSPHFRAQSIGTSEKLEQVQPEFEVTSIPMFQQPQTQNINSFKDKNLKDFTPETTGQTQRRGSFTSNHRPNSARNTGSRQNSKTKSKVLFKMKFENGDESYHINFREGDDPYNVAQNVIQKNGLDPSFIEDLQEQISGVLSQINR